MTAVLVTATGTEIGKTWTACGLATELRRRGHGVHARKPAQSFTPAERGSTDAELLAAATGEAPEQVCPAHRWYEVPMAPFMAADVLGRPRIRTTDLAAETGPVPAVGITLVEGAGGPRSPLAHDGDTIDLARALGIGRAILVADAGLGTINAVRLCVEALSGFDTIVFLNRFDPADDLHRRNRDWLADAGYAVTVDPPGLADGLLSRLP
jgi:dethiobiotin synthetase